LFAVGGFQSDADTYVFATESMIVAAEIIVGVVSTMVFPSITTGEQTTSINKSVKTKYLV
jgi:hypothetical protein